MQYVVLVLENVDAWNCETERYDWGENKTDAVKHAQLIAQYRQQAGRHCNVFVHENGCLMLDLTV